MFQVISIQTSGRVQWTIEYDKELGMYKVSKFEDERFVEDVVFDEYDSNILLTLKEIK